MPPDATTATPPRLDLNATRPLYFAATQFRGDAPVNDVDVWARALGRVDADVLRELGREVRDVMPFVPMLRVLQALRLVSESAELDTAEAHLRHESQRLLDAMGFHKLRPDDVLRRVPPMFELSRDVFARL